LAAAPVDIGHGRLPQGPDGQLAPELPQRKAGQPKRSICWRIPLVAWPSPACACARRVERAMGMAARRRRTAPQWETLKDEDLLRMRLKDLHVSVKGTWLEEQLAALNEELSAHNIAVQAHAWISDEWFSPDNTPGISMPFYLAHPRLMRLERKMMLDVEG